MAILVLPWVSFAVGLVLGIASLSPSVVFLQTVRVSGQVGPHGATVTPFPYTGYNAAEIAFEERPSCALRLYGLNPAQADAYNASSTLPGPENSLHCERLRAGYRGQVALFVINNSFNGTEPYAFRIDLFSASQPYALLALSAVLFASTGALAIAFRRLQSGTVRLAQEYTRRKR